MTTGDRQAFLLILMACSLAGVASVLAMRAEDRHTFRAACALEGIPRSECERIFK